jgi:hypothetical protein
MMMPVLPGTRTPSGRLEGHRRRCYGWRYKHVSPWVKLYKQSSLLPSPTATQGFTTISFVDDLKGALTFYVSSKMFAASYLIRT